LHFTILFGGIFNPLKFASLKAISSSTLSESNCTFLNDVFSLIEFFLTQIIFLNVLRNYFFSLSVNIITYSVFKAYLQLYF
jgi:hypothetical protein